MYRHASTCIPRPWSLEQPIARLHSRFQALSGSSGPAMPTRAHGVTSPPNALRRAAAWPCYRHSPPQPRDLDPEARAQRRRGLQHPLEFQDGADGVPAFDVAIDCTRLPPSGSPSSTYSSLRRRKRRSPPTRHDQRPMLADPRVCRASPTPAPSSLGRIMHHDAPRPEVEGGLPHTIEHMDAASDPAAHAHLNADADLGAHTATHRVPVPRGTASCAGHVSPMPTTTTPSRTTSTRPRTRTARVVHVIGAALHGRADARIAAQAIRA